MHPKVSLGHPHSLPNMGCQFWTTELWSCFMQGTINCLIKQLSVDHISAFTMYLHKAALYLSWISKNLVPALRPHAVLRPAPHRSHDANGAKGGNGPKDCLADGILLCHRGHSVQLFEHVQWLVVLIIRKQNVKSSNWFILPSRMESQKLNKQIPAVVGAFIALLGCAAGLTSGKYNHGQKSNRTHNKVA